MTTRALLALFALGLCGCQLERAPERRSINSYLADERDLANVRRIMILPFTSEDGVLADRERIRDSFVNELQKLRRFEIVPLPERADEDDTLNASLRRGKLSTDAFVKLCNRYNLDGVYVGNITAWRPYLPPHLGLRTQLLSVHSGSTVWAVDAMYDSSDRATVSDLRHYHERVSAADGTLHGWEMNTLAPTKFASYVAYRFVGTWVED
ncbi:MAG: hypothetical protein IPK26_19340 [Planctomycetes bacterium]|nr:hypothetical protein [Planctomycetota bacterium]